MGSVAAAINVASTANIMAMRAGRKNGHRRLNLADRGPSDDGTDVKKKVLEW